jgi:hypothetical protein
MEQKEQIAATLLHDKECPVGYKCLATDCMECLKIHMEKGTEDGRKKEV